MQSHPGAPSQRIRVRRHPERGVYEREVIRSILDEGLVAHVAFIEADAPVVIPTAYGRDGDTLYLHGSAVARWSKILAAGAPVCVTVTLLDGLVLARSAFKHSMNYRSVVIFGRAVAIGDRTAKLYALERIVEHLVPGRLRDARPPTDQELAATSVLRLDLNESSAKIRAGGPLDSEDDQKLAIWAGVLPARLTLGPPLADDLCPPTLPVPDYLLAMCRR